jgi:N6-adenosine-specific RNA methylase IME4
VEVKVAEVTNQTGLSLPLADVEAGRLSVAREAPRMLAFVAGLTEVSVLTEAKAQAAAVEAYLAQRRDQTVEEYNATIKIKARIEHRLGEVLAVTVKHGGHNKKQDNTVLSCSAGELPEEITPMQSSRAQQFARVPWTQIEAGIDQATRRNERVKLRQVVQELARGVRAEELAGRSIELVSVAGLYPIVYADPPWQYEHAVTESRAVENHYPTMPLGALCRLQIAAADDAVLFLWATNPKLSEALQVINAWGFEYRTNMAWVKNQKGMGYYVRQRHELLLIARRGNMPVPEPKARPDSIVEAPRGRHSAKPEVFYDVIERMYPKFPKLELFQRTPREGWHGIGNELESLSA